MTKKNDPDLAPDAALATDLGDPVERHAKQVAEMGGDIDDIDSYDPSGEDDGSVLPDDYDPLKPAPAASQDDDDDDDDADSDDSDGDKDDDDSDGEGSEDEDEADEEEADEEEADEADANDDSEDEGEADSKPAAKGIPKHRFDEVNERRKAAEAEAERLRAQIEAGKPPEEKEAPYDIRANEKEYMDLLLDGDTDGALAKREEIDAAKEAKWRAETKTETKTDLDTQAEEAELVSLSREAEAMFDVFNPDSENYDQAMLNKVLVFMKGYEAQGGISRGDAFINGLADVVEMYDLMPPEEGADEDPEPKPTGKKKVDKKKAALKKKAVTPAGLDGQGSADAGAATPNIEDMTDEELDALPEKTLARLRGDFG